MLKHSHLLMDIWYTVDILDERGIKMASDKLYECAFEYKKTKLWKKLWDTEIFAVKFSDGEIGYVSVMGKGGTYTGIAVYVGDDGFQSFREIAEGETESSSFFKERERMLKQSCLQVAFETKGELREEELAEVRDYAKKHGIRLSGKNAYPQFLKYVPNKYPWNLLSEKEETYIEETLKIAINIAGQLNGKSAQDIGIKAIDGETEKVVLFKLDNQKNIMEQTALPKKKKEVYPQPTGLDDFTISTIRRIKKKEIFECELVRLPEPVQNTPEEQPVFPMMLMLVSAKDGMILPVNIVADYEENPEQILQNMAEALKTGKRRPGKLLVRDERTKALLDNFGKQMGIEVRIERDLPHLDEAQECMIEEIWADGAEDDDMFQLQQMIESMEKLPDDVLRSMPDELIEQLEIMADSGALPLELQYRIDDILDRI